VRHAGVVVIDRLFAAVRDLDWSTFAADVVEVSAATEPSLVRVSVDERGGTGFTSKTLIEIAANGMLTARVEVVAAIAMAVNRWGFNLCLGAGLYAGSRVDACNVTETVFPRSIAPQLSENGVLLGMFPPARRLVVARPDGLRLEVESVGQLLEVEDQRNWTDATYKVYSGSLQADLPLTLLPGDRLTQVLTARWTTPAGSAVHETSAGSTPASAAWGDIVELPRIGVQGSDAMRHEVSSKVVDQALRWLGVDHVRVDVEPDGSDVRLPTWCAARPVELAVLIDGNHPETVRALGEVIADLPPRSWVLLHYAARRNTGAVDVDRFRELTGAASVPVVPGTDVYFADLNRNPPVLRDGLVSFSVIPTTHFTDLQAIFESLPVQSEVVAQARAQFSAGIVVSPITLRLRGDPEGRSDDRSLRGQILARHLDRRLNDLSMGAWTLGSICSLASAGAVSGTWHELIGPRGIVSRDSGRTVFAPAFHAICALRASTRPRVRPLYGTDSVAGLALPEQSRAVLCSLRPWRQHLDATRLFPNAVAATRRRLREEDLPAALGTPQWWSGEPGLVGDPAQMQLEPFEITEVAW